MSIQIKSNPLKNDFYKNLISVSSSDINMCFQCGKCSSGCPVSYAMDINPTQVIHLARLGQKEKLLKSKAIWLCASCETCTTRCPHKVDIAGVMNSLRILALKEKVEPGVPEIPIFAKSMLTTIKAFGRTFELGFIGLLKLKTGNIKKDLFLGIKMLIKGKLKLLPSISKPREIKKIFTKIKQKEGNV